MQTVNDQTLENRMENERNKVVNRVSLVTANVHITLHAIFTLNVNLWLAQELVMDQQHYESNGCYRSGGVGGIGPDKLLQSGSCPTGKTTATPAYYI